jgi:hypothetical protein
MGEMIDALEDMGEINNTYVFLSFNILRTEKAQGRTAATQPPNHTGAKAQ